MKIREPINSITHLIGLILSVLALMMLLNSSIVNFSIENIVSAAVFSIGLIGLYSASTIYHWSTGSDHKLTLLRKFDHIMIYVLIASTYTPICLITLKGTTGYFLLTAIWVLVIMGTLFKILWINAPRWISTGLYLFLGWLSLLFIVPISRNLHVSGVKLLVLGGIMYTIGAIIYGTKSEKLKIWKFGFHEIFHLFILLGSICHFLMIFNYVIR